jgi:hypothetical protein
LWITRARSGHAREEGDEVHPAAILWKSDVSDKTTSEGRTGCG